MSYRSAGRDGPLTHELCYVQPGAGLRDVWVGRATADDVLRAFGDTGTLHRYSTSGEIFEISYRHDRQGEYRPDRAAQHNRPEEFTFAFGLLASIRVGVYQRDLYTDGDVRIGAPRAQVHAAFGPEDERLVASDLETLRYRRAGIQLTLGSDGCVMSFEVFRAQR